MRQTYCGLELESVPPMVELVEGLGEQSPVLLLYYARVRMASKLGVGGSLDSGSGEFPPFITASTPSVETEK